VALGWGPLGVEDLEEELLVELGELAARGVGEELGGEVGEHAVVAHGVIGEGLGERWGEQQGVAGAAGEVGEAVEELVAAGVLEAEAGADARAEGQEVVVAQALAEAGIAGEDDASGGCASRSSRRRAGAAR